MHNCMAMCLFAISLFTISSFRITSCIFVFRSLRSDDRCSENASLLNMKRAVQPNHNYDAHVLGAAGGGCRKNSLPAIRRDTLRDEKKGDTQQQYCWKTNCLLQASRLTTCYERNTNEPSPGPASWNHKSRHFVRIRARACTTSLSCPL